MNSHLKSIGKVFLVCLAAVSAGLAFSSCSSSRKSSRDGVELPAPGDEVSLKADRSALAELRKDVPEEVKKQNDESALVLNLMAGDKTEPSTLREKWSDMVRKRRDAFDKWARKNRDSFNDTERKEREALLEKQSKAREEFASGKHTADERQKFYDGADETRKEFFSQQHERRDEFESIIREKRQSFNEDISEKQADFEQSYREYTHKFQDARTEKERQQKSKELERERKEEAAHRARANEDERSGASVQDTSVQPNANPGLPPAGLTPAQQTQRDRDLSDFQKMPSEHAIPLSTDDATN